jgi:hypothetical protein
MSLSEGTYKDFINKSKNWCTKLNEAGILSNDQLNQCIANVDGTNTNFLPPILDIPRTGIEYNYGIYNKNISNISSKINDSNTDVNYITNINGNYLAVNNQNQIYFINEINSADTNQSDISWTLIQQGNTNQYAILSPYNTYLIANNDYNVNSNGSVIGPASLWTLTKIDRSFIAQSVLYPTYYLNYNPNLNIIELNNNKNEFSSWTLYPQFQNNINLTNTISTQDDTYKQQLISNLIEKTKLFKKISIFIEILNELKNSIITKYTQVLSYVQTYLNTNINILSADKTTIINKINTSQTKIINDLNTLINNYNNTLNNLQQDKTNAEQQFNNFKQEVDNFIKDYSNKFQSNDIVIQRQNMDLSDYKQKLSNNQEIINKLKKNETLKQINMEMLLSYYNSNKYYNYIYPVIILFYGLFLLYCLYILYDKFVRNIINEYF